MTFAQKVDQFEPFISSDYSNNNFLITKDSIKFFDMIIESRMILNKSKNDPFACRAWLTIQKKGQVLLQRYFKNINAVGGCFGIFIPYVQPRKDYLIISKYGDYDSRLFVIDSIGNITENFGGELFVSLDKRYLFSHSDADGPRLTVFDFVTGKCLYSKIIGANLEYWYFQDGKFISTIWHVKPEDNAQKYVLFDIKTNGLIISTKNDVIPNSNNMLPDYAVLKNDCNCGLERKNKK